MGILISFPQKPAAPAGSQSHETGSQAIAIKPRPGSLVRRLASSFSVRVPRPAGGAVKAPLGLRSFSWWIKGAQALALAIAVCFSMGASSAGARVQDLDHRMMCTCGCAQLLGECNHVGCTESTQELSELRADIASGMSDQQIFNAFVAKYGATVLAAPPARGFDLVAWIAPFAVFLAALLGTLLLIRRWGGLRGFHPQHAGVDDLSTLDPAERDRIERIRRDTDSGSDGGSTR
ncbi:MAG: cytochrome c-type biogenesis protein CcmH [Acidobacteriota bacterium]